MNEAQSLINDTNSTIELRIKQGLEDLDISYGDRAIGKLIDYLHLLREWNKTHNLTAVDDLNEMVSIHILDSASIKPYVKGATLLDVGSGAGLPGMVLAILSPALQVTSIESRNKKAQFQMFVANKLGLENFTVVNQRVEEFEPKEKFSMITARAFSSIENLVQGSKQAIASNGRWLAMKGQFPKDELKAIKKLSYDFDTYAITVPELEAERSLVVIQAPK